MKLRAGDLVTLNLPRTSDWYPYNQQWDGIVGTVTSKVLSDNPIEVVTVTSLDQRLRLNVCQNRCILVNEVDRELNPIHRKIRELHRRQKFFITHKDQLPSWQI